MKVLLIFIITVVTPDGAQYHSDTIKVDDMRTCHARAGYMVQVFREDIMKKNKGVLGIKHYCTHMLETGNND